MKAGILGVPDHNFGPIESYSETTVVDAERDLTACLEVRSTKDTGEFVHQTGRAAIQELSSDERVSIKTDENSISVSEDIDVVKTKYTEFVLVPSEFVAVSSSSGKFAFNLISSQTDTATISPAEIDLNRFIESYAGESRSESASSWQVGFYGNSGSAEKGVVYGDSVYSDSELGGIIERLPKSQIGLDIEGEENIRMTATESGYVDIYGPSNYDSEEFVQFILDHVLSHTSEKVE